MHPTRALRRLALGFASALALSGAVPALAGPDVTYPQLNAATTVQDLDILATWRASGPLTRVNASVLATYLQGKLGATYLQSSNNLSELTATAATARTNLGLGSAALGTVGTTGTSICQLNSNCTWTGTEAFNAAVSLGGGVTGGLGLTGNLSASGTGTFNGGSAAVSGAAGTFRDLALATSSVARWAVQVQNDAENPGTNTGSTLCIARFADNGASIDCPMQVNRATGLTTFFDGAAVGNGLTVNAGGLTVSAGGANILGGLTVSGAVSLPAGSITGTNIASGTVTGGNVASGTIAGSNIASGTVANANLATMAATTLKGNATGSAAAPSDLTAAQVVGLLGLLSSSGAGGPGSLTIPTNNGNVIVNFGKMTSAGANSNTATLNFATPYSSYELALCSGAGGGPASVASVNNSQITCHNNSGVQDVTWIVIGQ